MNEKTGARIVVEALERLGVKTIFGIPGIHNLDIYDELIDTTLEHITARNEAGAGFMADGYARSTGTPGVALVITGPGLTNIFTPMGEALHDAVPMVVISSQLTREQLGKSRGELHELRNSTIAAASVSKESRRIAGIEEIEATLRWAYEHSQSGRPGPVHVEIPYDILRELAAKSDAKGGYEAALPGAQISNLARALESAKNPVILAGGGAASAASQLRELADRLDIPTITTVAGKGVLDERSPLSLGGRIHLPRAVSFIEEADLLLLVGTQLSPTDLWQGALAPRGRVAAINVDPHDFPSFADPELQLRGDLSRLLKRLLDTVTATEHTGDRAKVVATVKEEADRELPDVLGSSEETVEKMRAVLAALREGLGERGVLTADMTTIAYAGISEYKSYEPASYLHPVGFGTLGYALPAALGVAVANRTVPVCALSGDGGFQFTMQELGPLCEAEAPVAVVLWNDDGYGEIRRTEEERHPGKRIGVDNRNPEFRKLGDAYGIEAVRVEDLSELAGEVAKTVAGSMPRILEVRA